MHIPLQFPSPRIYYSCLVGGPDFMKDPRVQMSAHGFEAGYIPYLRAVTNETDLNESMRQGVGLCLCVAIDRYSAHAVARAIGVTAVKIYANLEPALVAAVSAAAKKHGLRVWSHATIFPSRCAELLRAFTAS